jgi:hypothetical protein
MLSLLILLGALLVVLMIAVNWIECQQDKRRVSEE